MNPIFYSPIFYSLALIMIPLSILAVTSKHILRSAVYLMGVLILSAGIYLVLGADFIAGTQILVYVGGIVVLLVFAIMLTKSTDLREDKPTLLKRFIALAISTGFFATSSYLLLHSPLGENTALFTNVEPPGGSIASIGRSLVSTSQDGYLLPFEVISLLLLTVLIGGSVIARKDK